MSEKITQLSDDSLKMVSGGTAENDGSEDNIHILPPKEREKTVCGDCGYVAYGDYHKEPCPRCGSYNFG